MATEVTLVLRFEDGTDYPFESWTDVERAFGCILVDVEQEEV